MIDNPMTARFSELDPRPLPYPMTWDEMWDADPERMQEVFLNAIEGRELELMKLVCNIAWRLHSSMSPDSDQKTAQEIVGRIDENL